MADGFGVLIFIAIIVFIAWCAFRLHKAFKESKEKYKKLGDDINKPRGLG